MCLIKFFLVSYQNFLQNIIKEVVGLASKNTMEKVCVVFKR